MKLDNASKLDFVISLSKLFAHQLDISNLVSIIHLQLFHIGKQNYCCLNMNISGIHPRNDLTNNEGYVIPFIAISCLYLKPYQYANVGVTGVNFIIIRCNNWLI